MKLSFLLGLGLWALAPVLWAFDADAKAGAQSAAVCSACHQADGSGKHISGGESWPRLAGLNAAYLYKQLQDFKANKRHSPTMQPFVNMLSDQQMKDVALYFSQLPATQGQSDAASAEQLALGEKLVLNGDWERYIVPCHSCHGAQSQGVGEHFPALAGQQAGYIAQSLRAWQNGQRQNDPQQLMATIAKRLSAEDIVAVSAWLARQRAH